MLLIIAQTNWEVTDILTERIESVKYQRIAPMIALLSNTLTLHPKYYEVRMQ